MFTIMTQLLNKKVTIRLKEEVYVKVTGILRDEGYATFTVGKFNSAGYARFRMCDVISVHAGQRYIYIGKK